METRRWHPEIVDIGDRIVGLSVAEAARLVVYLDAVHGVKAFDLPLPPCVPQPDLVVAPIGDPEFSVALTGFAAAKKIVVIKTVRELTGLGLKEAKDFVEALPRVIKDPMSRADAEKLKAQLEAAGATVTVQTAT